MRILKFCKTCRTNVWKEKGKECPACLRRKREKDNENKEKYSEEEKQFFRDMAVHEAYLKRHFYY